jgi:hypothetical protein
MVRMPQVIYPSIPISIAHPHELHLSSMATTTMDGVELYIHTMHDESNTWNKFLISLQSYRNKPHSIQNLDAPGIDSDVFALVRFVASINSRGHSI